MSIADELREYINRWTCLTGHRPSAMPITDIEGTALWLEYLNTALPVHDADPDSVDSFLGVDLYITPDAKQRREQITARKEQ